MKRNPLPLFLSAPLLFSCSSGGGVGSSTPIIPEANIIGFSPASGEVGSLVTIQGSHFDIAPFATSVLFHGIPGTVQICTATSILVMVPPGSSTGKIAVVSPAGTFFSASDFHVLPSWGGVNPSSPPGAAVGEIVEILGNGFDGDQITNNVVSFNGVPATVLDANPTTINVSVPVGAKTGNLLVSTVEGTLNKPYTIKPSITGCAVNGNPANYGFPGDAVTLSGFNFQDSGNQVLFNGTPATVGAASYSTLQCVVPPGIATGPLTVTTVDGTATMPAFYLPAPPTISSFNPPSGIVGNSVTIHGTQFIPGLTQVKFNGTTAALLSQSTTTLVVSVPAGASTGPIEVSHLGWAASAGPYTLLLPPILSAVSPAFAGWGNTVTISGVNFDPSLPGNEIRFNGTLATSTQGSTTQLITTVPVGATPGPVTVQTAAGTASLIYDIRFSRYALIANTTENTLASYEMDAAEKQLRFQSYAFTGANSKPAAVAVNAAGTMAYVANSGTNTIGVYSLGLNGALASKQSPVATGIGPCALAFNANPGLANPFLYAVNKIPGQAQGSLTAFAVAADGTISLSQTISTRKEPAAIALHPSGQFLYVANQTGNSISAYSVDFGSGALSGIQTLALGSGQAPAALLMHPSGNWIYSANKAANALQTFSIGSDGKLLAIQNVGAGTGPVALAMDPLARRVYAANEGSNNVSTFEILPGGTLDGGAFAPVAAGSAPSAIMLDYCERAYVANRNDDSVSLFSVGPNGALSPLNLPQSPSPVFSHRGPACLTRVDGAGPVRALAKSAYIGNTYIPDAPAPLQNRILPCNIGADGALSHITSGQGPLQTGPDPRSVVADFSGTFIYTANHDAADSSTAAISIFKRDTDGSLGASGSVAAGDALARAGKNPRVLRAEPSGRFLFALNDTNPWIANPGDPGDGANVSAFSISSQGALAAVPNSPLPMSENYNPGFNYSVTALGADIHPSGRFFYVLSGDGIEVLGINLNTGALNTIQDPASYSGSTQGFLGIHPSGRFLCVFRSGDGSPASSFQCLKLSASGTTTGPVQTIGSASDPAEIAFTPNGKFAYVSNRVSSSVSAYTVNAAAAQPLTRFDADPLTPGLDMPTGFGPSGITVDRSGKFLFVANTDDCGGGPGCVDPSSVSMYRIQANGTLVSVGAPFLSNAGGVAPKSVATVAEYQ